MHIEAVHEAVALVGSVQAGVHAAEARKLCQAEERSRRAEDPAEGLEADDVDFPEVVLASVTVPCSRFPFVEAVEDREEALHASLVNLVPTEVE